LCRDCAAETALAIVARARMPKKRAMVGEFRGAARLC